MGNSFKLTRGDLDQILRGSILFFFFFCGGDDKTLEQAVQRRGGCPIPGVVQSQVGWNLEHLDQVPSLVTGPQQ